VEAQLSSWGAGALLAWVALPLFARLARPRVHADAITLHRAQIAALGCAVALLAVPSLGWLVPTWLVPRAPYYALELHAVLEPLSRARPFGPGGLATTLSFTTIVGAGWLLAVLFASLRSAVGALKLRRVLGRAMPAPAPLVDTLRSHAAAKGVRMPELLISDHTAIPFATGLLKSTIVVPRELVRSLDPLALELVLEHELEHVRRGDVRTAALVTALKILLGGHPTAEKVGRESLLAREIAVDSRVSPRDPRAYASLLVEIAAHAHFGERPAFTAIDDTALARRIALITEPVVTRRLSIVPVGLAAATVTLVACLARTVVAWSPPAPLHFAFARPGVPGRGMGHSRPGGGLKFGYIARSDAAPPHARFSTRARLGPPPPSNVPVLIEQSPDVRACYTRAASSNPTLAVTAMFLFALEPTGNMSVSVTVPDAPNLEPCLKDAVSRLPIAPPPEPGLKMVVNLELTPESMIGPTP
jgi:beta-lactamase regulating signal transducer with metallopeptidase domain